MRSEPSDTARSTMVCPADRLPGLTCWLVTFSPWLRSDSAISAALGPGTMAPSTLSTSIVSAPPRTGIASEIARALIEGLLHGGNALAFLGIFRQATADRRAHAGIGPRHAHHAIRRRLEADQ